MLVEDRCKVVEGACAGADMHQYNNGIFHLIAVKIAKGHAAMEQVALHAGSARYECIGVRPTDHRQQAIWRATPVRGQEVVAPFNCSHVSRGTVARSTVGVGVMLSATVPVRLELLVGSGPGSRVAASKEVGVAARATKDVCVAAGRLVGPTASWQAANSRTLAARSCDSSLVRLMLGPFTLTGIGVPGWCQVARSGCDAIMPASYPKVKGV